MAKIIVLDTESEEDIDVSQKPAKPDSNIDGLLKSLENINLNKKSPIPRVSSSNSAKKHNTQKFEEDIIEIPFSQRMKKSTKTPIYSIDLFLQ